MKSADYFILPAANTSRQSGHVRDAPYLSRTSTSTETWQTLDEYLESQTLRVISKGFASFYIVSIFESSYIRSI